MTDMRESSIGPSDREVVALLQRLASARAHLLHAEAQEPAAALARKDDIEDAHAELLWAQAELITASREHRARRVVDAAQERERNVLLRHGFSSFRAYLAERTSRPTLDTHLEVARREYAAAQAEWDELSRLVAEDEAANATIVIDLTGDEPRRII
jgi:hypothetical protein